MEGGRRRKRQTNLQRTQPAPGSTPEEAQWGIGYAAGKNNGFFGLMQTWFPKMARERRVDPSHPQNILCAVWRVDRGPQRLGMAKRVRQTISPGVSLCSGEWLGAASPRPLARCHESCRPRQQHRAGVEGRQLNDFFAASSHLIAGTGHGRWAEKSLRILFVRTATEAWPPGNERTVTHWRIPAGRE